MAKILFATDGSPEAIKSLHAIYRVAGSDAEITVLHVVEDYKTPGHLGDYLSEEQAKNLMEQREKKGKQIVEDAAKLLRERNLKVETMVIHGDPASAICRVADEGGFNVVAVGRKGLGGIRAGVLGSVSYKVAHHAKPNVLILK